MEWDKFKLLLDSVPKMWMRSWDSHEKEIEWWYKKFVERVSTGRDTTFAYIDSIGQGRIWSGKSAKDIGLIDEIGGILEAIELAKKEAGIEEAEVVLSPPKTQGFNIGMGMGINLKILDLLSEHYLYIMPYTLEISD